MSSHHQRLPEPALPESELIRAADTLPELSSGLRSATLVVCGAQIRRAQRIRRIRGASMSIVIASVLLAVWSAFTATPTDSLPPVAQETPARPNWSSTGDVKPGPETGSVISLGSPGNSRKPAELETPDRIIEKIQQRTQDVMDAGMVPGF